MSLLCLGESLVDLIRTGGGAGEPERFEAHFGGALGNVAVAIARAGSPAALAGGSGDDEFGRLLRGRLEREGVDLRWMGVLDEVQTPFAFVRLDAGGEPDFRIHGNGIDAGVAALAGHEDEILATAKGVLIGSNTLVSGPARAVTLGLVAGARARDVPVLFDPNLRPRRWRDPAEALAICREVAAECLLVKANLGEARELLGAPSADAATAAEGLHTLGAAIAVVTDGPRAAAMRGRSSAEATPPPASVASPLGAGDAFMGTLAAGLHAGGWSPESGQEALERATAVAAEACARLGAVD